MLLRKYLFMVVAVLCCSNGWAEENMTNKKIVPLDPGELDQVESHAVVDYPFMQVIEGENPQARTLTRYQSDDGKFEVGFYQLSQVTLSIKDWPVDEFMYFLEGQVEITDHEGASMVYGAGDTLVMPKGFSGTWRQLSPIKKINISYPSE